MRILTGIALVAGVGLASTSCNNDGSSGSGHDPVVYHIPLEISLEEAAAQALPGDTLAIEGVPSPLTDTIVFSENQTPLVLTGTKVRPSIVAPSGLPAFRFTSPKAGTRIAHLAFAGGNTTISISGSGSFAVDDCKFSGGQIQIFGSGENLTLSVSRCEFLRPQAFGIEVQSSTTLHADKVTVVAAGDCGILITGSATGQVTHSVLYNSANFGIACTAQGTLTGNSGCNDIFGSTPVGNCTEPATDLHLELGVTVFSHENAYHLDERKLRPLVAAVEREAGEDLSSEIRRADAVPGEAEAVVHPSAATEDRQMRG